MVVEWHLLIASMFLLTRHIAKLLHRTDTDLPCARTGICFLDRLSPVVTEFSVK